MKEWRTRKLGEVATVIDGPHATPKTVGSGPIFLGIGALQDGLINLGETRHVTEEDFKLWTRRATPQAGDVVFSYETRLGQAALIPPGLECCLGRRMGLVRFHEGTVIPRFFLYQYLSPSFREFLDSKTIRGATVDRISIKEFPSFPIAVPPLSEQHRIVAILDEAFDGIATAKANAEQNLQNARALFDTYLNAVYLERGADTWPMRRLGDVFEIGSSKRIHERDWSPSGVPFYGGKEIVKLAKFGHAVSNAYISEQKYDDYASKYDMPKPGDILITARGTIGVGYVVQKSDKFYYKDGNIISMRAKNAANPHFLLYAFRSKALADQLGDLSGTTVTHLPLEKAKELLLRMPEIDIQDTMVKQTMEFEGETQRLESFYRQKLAALDEMKKSLLHQAFSGAL